LEGGLNLISKKGPVVGGKEFELDALIFATGFEWMATGTFNSVIGRDGKSLQEKWTEGTRTFLGIQSEGFPNLFILNGPQGGGGSFNFTTGAENHALYAVWMLKHMRETGATVVDIKPEAENEFVHHCAVVDTDTKPLRDCISYYNAEGTAKPGSLAYYGGDAWGERVRDAQRTLQPYVFWHGRGTRATHQPEYDHIYDHERDPY